ncbi:MAG: hypothetical protein AB1724_17080 [Thermodesulfobacteriota bacterium]
MTEDKKKEKVLHTRISHDLEKQIREEAGSLGVSVSNLVRNILGNTFDLVENIVTDSAAITRSARRRSGLASAGKHASAPEPADTTYRVIGWQEAVLNLNAVCSQCNEILKKGSRAAIAIIEGSGPRPSICLNCLKEVSHENDNDADDNE